MHFAKEQVDKNGECPQEDIVNPIGHRILLDVLGVMRYMLMNFLLGRHLEVAEVDTGCAENPQI